MASSKFSSSLSLFLSLNLLFFSLASGCGNSCPNPSPNNPSPKPTPENPSPKPTPNNPSTGHHQKRCPRDALKLGVCADVLKLVHVVVGTPPKLPCCTLLEGLVELEAALCLCTAIKANVLGINLNIPLSLSLLLNYCGKKVPTGFQCA